MKAILKFLLWVGLFLFILVNIFVIMHAYKFTHFKEGNSRLTRTTPHVTPQEKIQSLLLGVDLPRPLQQYTPNYRYQHIQIASNAILDAWLTNVKNARGTVMLFHGYGGEKSSLNNYAAQFQRMGYNTLQVDFMGAGASSDEVVTLGYKEAVNVKDVFNYLKARDHENIIGYGVSMGAVALLKACNDYQLPLSGIILECPFGSMLGTVKARFDMVGVPPFPMAHLLTFWGGAIHGFNAFSHNAVTYAKGIGLPVLLMSGADDEYVTQQEIKDIYDRLQGEKNMHIIRGARHENYVNRFTDEWITTVQPFLKKL